MFCASYSVCSVLEMQTSKFKSVLRLASCNKDIVRTVAVTTNGTEVKLDANLKSWREVPGPSSLPIIGQLHHFLPGGRRIAELEIETFLARIIENFKVEWSGPPPKQVATSLIYIKGPFNFIFKDLK